MESGESRAPRSWADRHIWQITPLRDALIAAVLVLVVWLCLRTRHVLLPVFVGLLLAYICHPLITYAQRRWAVRRPLSAGVILAVFLALLTGMGIWLVPLLVEQIASLIERAPEYLRRLGIQYGFEMDDLATQAQTWATGLQEQPLVLVSAIGGVVGATSRVLLWLVLPPISFFFFAWWMPGMYARALRYVPASRRQRVDAILGKMNAAVGSFLRARLIVAVLIGVLFSFGFYLVRVPYWFVLGMGTGLLGLIPYLSAFGWIIAVLVKYFDMSASPEAVSWVAVLLWPSVVYWGVNLLEEWVIMPWVQSREMDLSALTVLVVALLGGVLAGLLGLLLAVPIAACLKIFMIEVVLPRLERWSTRT